MNKDFSQFFGLLPGWVPATSAAAAVYGLFRYLDNKASGAAKKTIAAWLNDERYERIDLALSVVNLFDRLFGSRLWSVNGALRSAIWTTIAIALYALVSDNLRDVFTTGDRIDRLIGYDSIIILMLYVSDYISLFAVRGCLIISKRNIYVSLALSILSAMFIVIICSYISFIGIYMWGGVLLGDKLTFGFLNQQLWIGLTGSENLYFDLFTVVFLESVFATAFVIHLWIERTRCAGVAARPPEESC